LVAAGATVIGPKPQRTPGLADYPRSEQRLREIADTLWGRETPSNRSPLPPAGRGQAASDAAKSSSGSWTGPQGGFPPLQRGCGKGSVACGPSIREVLEKAAVPPDFAFQSKMENALLDFIHRRDDHVEIYFVANRGAAALNADCTFRVSGKQPELWDPVTGEHRDLPQFLPKDGRTSLALKFEPYGSMFVVFRKEIPKSEDRFQNPGVGNGNRAKVNFPELKPVREIAGPWTVQFDPQWFYPTAGLSGDQAKGLMVFDKLDDWTRRAEPAVRDFSGTATYRTRFPWTGGETTRKKIFLGLGTVKVTAGVRLNGKQLGVVWCHPWRIEVAAALKPGENTLEIDVVNLWPNRLLADSKLTPQQRRTRTSGPLRATIAPLPSGLLGPVRLMAED
jgi:hypothetical protein